VRAAFALFALGCTSGWVTLASAQTEAENKAAARALGIEGIKLANAGDCAQAIDRLQRAEQLYHAPTILGRLGECQIQLGQLVVGTENLRKVVREPLGPDAPAAFIQAQERAQQVLDEAVGRIARLTVNVAAPQGVAVQVMVDGQLLPVALVGVERPIDPGDHALSITAEGYQRREQSIALAEGGTEAVTLVLGPPVPAPQPAGPPPLVAPQAPVVDTGPAPAEDSTEQLLGYVSLAVGAVGFGMGTVFGLRATRYKSDLQGVCDGSRCPPSAQDDIDSMNSAATVSTVGFAVGIIGAGVGTYLLLAADGSSEQAPPSAGQSARAHASLWVGLGRVGMVGAFQ
jgi:hypothetical protein